MNCFVSWNVFVYVTHTHPIPSQDKRKVSLTNPQNSYLFSSLRLLILQFFRCPSLTIIITSLNPVKAYLVLLLDILYLLVVGTYESYWCLDLLLSNRHL